MASATLIWTPGGGANSLSQEIQYKVHTDSSPTTAAMVGAAVNTYTITGLLDNVIYDYWIVDHCAVGGPTPGQPSQAINLTCPAVTLNPDWNLIQYSFADLGGSVSGYNIFLFDANGNTLATNNAPIGGSVTGTFTGLNPSSNYKVGVTVNAGTFTKTCPPQSVSTIAPPACNAPGSVTATMS